MSDGIGALPTPAQAHAIIRESVPVTEVELRPLLALNGRVLRQSVHAERDQPPFHRVAMDGIAIASSSWDAGRREFRILGVAAAGAPPLTLTDPAACIEAMTGAMLPAGCDCVIPVEQLERTATHARVVQEVPVTPMLNVHTQAADSRRGDELLSSGTVMNAPEIAIVASAGLDAVQVARQPRILVISTGDELVEPGQPITDWQIRRSNAYAVVAALQARGFDNVHHDHLPDDLEVLRTRLRTHLDAYDTLVLSGGVSMGRFDHIPQVLTELGVAVLFHKVAQRPGKPLWFGVRKPGKAVYALPGNPVSTLTCCVRYVIPGLYAAMGTALTPQPVMLGGAVTPSRELTLFVPVKLDKSPDGTAVAMPYPTKGSGDFVSLRGTHGCIEVPPGTTPGACVSFYPW